jgi:hypothetical protein
MPCSAKREFEFLTAFACLVTKNVVEQTSELTSRFLKFGSSSGHVKFVVDMVAVK